MKTESNLTKNTILLSIGTILNKGILFVMVPLFSSWLTTEDYGTFDLLCTYSSLLIPILMLSNGEAVFRYIVDSQDEENKKAYISNGLGITLVGLAFFGIILFVLNIKKNWFLMFPFFLLVSGEVLNKNMQNFLRGIRKLQIYSFGTILTTVFIVIFATIFVKFKEMGLIGIVLGYSLGYMCGNIMLIAVGKYWKYISVKLISLKKVIKMIRYSAPLILSTVSWWIINASDRFIINIFIGAVANGIFAVAHKVPTICAALFQVFTLAWQEKAVDMIEGDKRNGYFSSKYNQIIKIFISICIGVLSINFVLFDYIFEFRYAEARQYTPILILATFFMSLAQFWYGIEVSLKESREIGTATVIGAIENVICHVVLIKWIGLYAACISTLLAQITVNNLRKKHVLKHIQIHVQKDNIIMIVAFAYYFIMSSLKLPLWMNICNLLGACIIFLVVNKAIIYKIFLKLKNIN